MVAREVNATEEKDRSRIRRIRCQEVIPSSVELQELNGNQTPIYMKRPQFRTYVVYNRCKDIVLGLDEFSTLRNSRAYKTVSRCHSTASTSKGHLLRKLQEGRRLRA